mgnify:FL=1
MKFYSAIASAFAARANCERSGNSEWFERHTERIRVLVREHAVSGSGFDSGTSFSFDASLPDRLVFVVEFHHMSEHGYYDGWTSHFVIVTPSLAHGFNLRITGRDRNDIKDYIGEVFHNLADVECTQ